LDSSDIDSLSLGTDLIHRLYLYGGEPLMQYNKCVNICHKAGIFLSKVKKSLSVSIITNGYFLSRERSQELAELGAKSVQITIDGTRENHNKNRSTKEGYATYDTIMANAIAASEYMRVHIRCNVDATMDGDITQLRYICRKYGMHFKISPVLDITKDNKKSVNMLYYKSIINNAERCVASRMKGKFPCIALANNPLGGSVLVPNGDIYRCWNEVSNDIASYNNILNNKCNNLHNNWDEWNPYNNIECQECKMLPTCSGGCPYYAVYQGDKYCSFSNIHEYEQFIIANYLNIVKGGE
jgi:uncharacterized protein